MGNFIGKVLKSNFASAGTIKIPLAEGVTAKHAASSMEQQALSYGMKLTDHSVLAAPEKTIPTMENGQPSPYLEIFLFHKPVLAQLVSKDNWDFAPYMPCKILLYQDKDKRFWLATMNLGALIYGIRHIEPELKSQMIKVKDQLLPKSCNQMKQ